MFLDGGEKRHEAAFVIYSNESEFGCSRMASSETLRSAMDAAGIV